MPSPCSCHTPPLHYSDYESEYLGIDRTNGRFGEVTLERCTKCKAYWLRYFVEYESFSESGRWYRGLIPKEDIPQITPENSVAFLTSLDWYLYGGSYFRTTGKIGNGTIYVDL